jgi:predicted outer membrane protein
VSQTFNLDVGGPMKLARRSATRPGFVLALAVVVGLIVGLAAPVAAARVDNAGLPDGWTMTRSGPLGPADREVLIRVRLAGLWEAPAGQMAQDRAGNPKVKEVGHHIATEHIALDERVRALAASLGVPLPGLPSAEQQVWLDEMSAAQGNEFDRIFADRLRVAHGKVFGFISTVRAGTRNDEIREFAQSGVTIVMRHMTLLESTGMVDYEALPTAAPPAAGPPNFRNPGAALNPGVIWMVLGIALAVGLITAVRVVRPR